MRALDLDNPEPQRKGPEFKFGCVNGCPKSSNRKHPTCLLAAILDSYPCYVSLELFVSCIYSVPLNFVLLLILLKINKVI